MKMSSINTEWFPFLTDCQLMELENFFSKKPKKFMAHELAINLGVDWSKGMSIISILYAKMVIDAKLLIYHNCNPDLPVGASPIKNGYPELPFYCEECDVDVTDYSELNFDFIAIMGDRIS